MDNLLMILRWAGALFLFLLAGMFPIEMWKKREQGLRGIVEVVVSLAIAGMLGTLGYGIISSDWGLFWQIFRYTCALIFLAIATAAAAKAFTPDSHTLLHVIVHLCFGGLFVPLAVSFIFMDWRWLLLIPAIALLGGILMLTERARNRRRLIKGIQEITMKTSGEKLSREQAAHRLALGETVAIGAALEEMRQGRTMSPQEVEAFAMEQKEAFARADKEQEEEQKQQPLERDNLEAARKALQQAMQTGPSAARCLSISQERETTLEGEDGTKLLVPAGHSRLWLQMEVPLTGKAYDGYPEVSAELWIEGGSRVRISLALTDIAGLQELQAASWWKQRDKAWQTSFCEHILLEPTECFEDEAEMIELPLNGETLNFYSRNGEKAVALSCPDPGDSLWCRVHGLTYMEEDGDWVTVEPLCFKVPIERILQSHQDQNRNGN